MAPINTVPKNGFEFESSKSLPEKKPVSEAPLQKVTPVVEKEAGTPAPKPKAVPAPSSSKLSKPVAPPRQPVKLNLHEKALHSTDHTYEIRAGPRISWLDGKIRPGLDGSSQLDLRDDLGLKEVGVGSQVDFEMRFSDEWHASFSYAGSSFDTPTITTKRQLTYQNANSGRVNPNTQNNPAVLAVGSTLQTQLDFHTLDMLLQYDAYKEKSLTLSPLLGLKGYFIKQKLNIVNAANNFVTIDTTFLDGALPLAGLDAQYQFSPYIYAGATTSGSALDKCAYLHGGGYVGLSLNDSFGLRLGVDVDYISITRGNTNPTFSENGIMMGTFLQGVYGF